MLKLSKEYSNVKTRIIRNLKNIPGRRTKKKIVVFESDDWGSIRMPSIETYNTFILKGFPIKTSIFNRLDTLESNDDLNQLFEVLNSHKDSTRRAAVITANTIIANPDYEKIKNTKFETYHYELFTKTLEHYPSHNQVINLYQEGIKNRIFHPQFHGREHLQVNRWMKALQSGRSELMFTFENGTTFSGKDDYNFMEAFDWDKPEEVNEHKEIIFDGLRIFKEIFGYNSKSFIAPCTTWSPEIEQGMIQQGVEYIQGSLFQSIPRGGFENYKRKLHILGEKNKYGQLFLIRNCAFEPSIIHKSNWVEYTLKAIETAFYWHKPAIISTHRVNFIGSLDEQNRIKNLKLFDELLGKIIKKWPEVEFMTSDELGDLISSES